jgi:hypothetical protein
MAIRPIRHLGRWRTSGPAIPISTAARQITSDAVTRRRGRDQGEPKLLCTIRQDGQSGDWAGEDSEGRPLMIENGANGLEVYAAPQAEGDQSLSLPSARTGADPAVVETTPPLGAGFDRLRRRQISAAGPLWA